MPELIPILTCFDPKCAPIKVAALGVSAGFPSPAGDDLEDEIDPIGWVVRRPGSTFWYRAEGDCLADIGIMDGDLIAFDRSGKSDLAVSCSLSWTGHSPLKFSENVTGSIGLILQIVVVDTSRFPIAMTWTVTVF